MLALVGGLLGAEPEAGLEPAPVADAAPDAEYRGGYVLLPERFTVHLSAPVAVREQTRRFAAESPSWSICSPTDGAGARWRTLRHRSHSALRRRGRLQ